MSTLEGHVDSVGAVALGKKGDELVCATASKDRTLKLWQDGQCTSSTIAHDKDINDVAFISWLCRLWLLVPRTGLPSSGILN